MRRLTREETESVNDRASSGEMAMPFAFMSSHQQQVGRNVTGAQRALTVARMKRLPRLSSAIRAFRAANLASAKLESLPSFG